MYPSRTFLPNGPKPSPTPGHKKARSGSGLPNNGRYWARTSDLQLVELVEAAAALFKNWNPDTKPTWVTAVSSQSHPELVPDFAERLAKAIGLPYSQAVSVAKKTKEQKKLENSRQQYLNVQGAFSVDREKCLAGSVLLVDDTVDSKWTLAEAGGVLRKSGSPALVPFALASTMVGG